MKPQVGPSSFYTYAYRSTQSEALYLVSTPSLGSDYFLQISFFVMHLYVSYIILQLYGQYLWKQHFPWCCQCKPTPQMLSAVIHFALGCSPFTVGMITSTPEVCPSQSSHTRERSSQCSNTHAGYGPNCLMTFWTQLTWFIVRGYMVLNRAKWWHAANPE